MKELGDDVYSTKMTQMKLKEKYGSSLKLVEMNGKSNIILLDRVSDILCEKWYQEKESDKSKESEGVVKTAAKLKAEHETNTYPSVDEILCTENSHVPELLKVLMDALVKSPLKQISIAQALFATTRPRSVMPLQFGLAVSTAKKENWCQV